MKNDGSLLLSLAAALFVCLLVPSTSSAESMRPSPANMPTADAQSNVKAQITEERADAESMVPAEVDLLRTIDARKDEKGSMFEARLDGTVHLENGTELPRGTTLEGKVAADQLKSVGHSRLTLRFTEAKLKDGKAIPIDATIVGISGPPDLSYDDNPLPWNRTSMQYDDIGVMSHVDLHSTIGARNSGTLVATDKSDMKLISGSRLTLALGERSSN